MSSLFGTISISLRALLADQAALQTATNNIANANTPGYSRRRVNLEEDTPVFNGSVMVPRGVNIASIESLRDRVLELRTYDQVQEQQSQQAIADSLQPTQLLFGEGSGSIGDSISKFFNALNQLSTDASDTSLRQSVLSAGSNLCTSVRNVASQIQQQQQSLDRNVVQCLTQINSLTSQIAAINAQISGKEKLGEEAGQLEDQRGELIRQLSQLVDVSTIDDSEGLTLTTSNGSPLVVGRRAYSLELTLDAEGLTRIQSQGIDITDTIKVGKLGGYLEVRDGRIPGLLDELDQFAYTFTNAMNAAHVQGTDLNGNTGTNLFVANAQAGAAALMGMAIADPRMLAASDDGSTGGTVNLKRLIDVQNSPIAGSMTPTQLYADLVFRVGTQIQEAQSNSEAGDLLVQQLDNQRAAISGVNMDEESANLVRFQRAFEAAARVVNVINELTETAINLGR